eukprot:scaffold3824_cov108-Isochrysis_galbana.AAC.6
MLGGRGQGASGRQPRVDGDGRVPTRGGRRRGEAPPGELTSGDGLYIHCRLRSRHLAHLPPPAAQGARARASAGERCRSILLQPVLGQPRHTRQRVIEAPAGHAPTPGERWIGRGGIAQRPERLPHRKPTPRGLHRDRGGAPAGRAGR